MKASNPVRIGHAIVAGFAFLAITLGNSAAVRAGETQVAGTSSGASADYNYAGSSTGATLSGGSTSAQATSVTFGLTFFTPAGPYAANVSLSASTSSAASSVGGTTGTQGGWSGSYTITNESGSTVGGVANGSVFLTVSFTGAILTLTGSGSNSTLSTATGGTTTITPASGFGSAIGQPESFTLTLSGTAFSGSHTGSNFQNFTANDSSTSSATLVTGVPEPSTMAIAGLGALGMIGYGLRRRKSA